MQFIELVDKTLVNNSTVIVLGMIGLFVRDIIASRKAERRRTQIKEDTERQRKWDIEDRERKAAEAHKIANDTQKVIMAEAQKLAAEAELLKIKLLEGQKVQGEKLEHIEQTSDDTLTEISKLKAQLQVSRPELRQ